MKKYLYLPCLAVLALAACDDNKSEQQQSSTVPDATISQTSPASGEDGVPAPVVNDNAEAADTMGNAGPDESITADTTPPAPSPETFNEEAAADATEADTTCGDYVAWVGQPVDLEAVKATGKDYRIVKPGDAITMDHNPDRINVEQDDAGNVTRVWCG